MARDVWRCRSWIIPILSKKLAVHWYCPKCENNNTQRQSANILKTLKTLNQRQITELENRKQEQEALNSMKIDILTIKSIMQQNMKPLHTSADKVKLARDPSPTSNLRKSAKKSERDVNKVLIVSGNHKFKDSVEIKKAFVKVLPMKNLVVPFNTARGNIRLEFLSSEEAQEVLNSWRPNYKEHSERL